MSLRAKNADLAHRLTVAEREQNRLRSSLLKAETYIAGKGAEYEAKELERQLQIDSLNSASKQLSHGDSVALLAEKERETRSMRAEQQKLFNHEELLRAASGDVDSREHKDRRNNIARQLIELSNGL